MKGSDFVNTDNEKVMIDEYEDLKKQDRENQELMFSDFAIKIHRGAVLHPSHPNYNDNRIKMEIFSADFTKLNKYSIQIDGKDYNIRSQNLFNKIKRFVSNNLDILISWSKKQTNENLNNNAFDGEMESSIQIKYGQLIVNVNGQTTNLREICNEFIDELKNLIINEGEKTQEDYLWNIEIEPQTLTPLDTEFNKYCKLYEEKFNKKAYIPEPHGTKEFAIDCIKKCLEENKDILDNLYYPNFKKDMENGVLYQETKIDSNNDKLKTIINEVIKDNEEMVGNNIVDLNMQVYDIVKKIIDLQSKTTTTIADLINYNPNEKSIEPLTQGQIRILVKETCKKLNIELEENKDGFSGLAYYYQFKKNN